MNQPDQEFVLFGNNAEEIDKQRFRQEVERLHQLTVWGRWLFVGCSWLLIGSVSLWGLRSVIQLWLEYPTWAALYYGLAFNRLPSLGLSFCLGMTLAVLVWQSRNILFGRPKRQQRQLEDRVHKIRRQGSTHPLWHWVCRPEV
jgi:hypothetical protein